MDCWFCAIFFVSIFAGVVWLVATVTKMTVKYITRPEKMDPEDEAAFLAKQKADVAAALEAFRRSRSE